MEQNIKRNRRWLFRHLYFECDQPTWSRRIIRQIFTPTKQNTHKKQIKYKMTYVDYIATSVGLFIIQWKWMKPVLCYWIRNKMKFKREKKHFKKKYLLNKWI